MMGHVMDHVMEHVRGRGVWWAVGQARRRVREDRGVFGSIWGVGE